LVAAALAFTSGQLILILPMDYVEEMYQVAGLWPLWIAFFGGAVGFALLDALVSRHLAKARAARATSRESRTRAARRKLSARVARRLWYDRVASETLDGLPESIFLGLSATASGQFGPTGQGPIVQLALLAAIFLSNIPEALRAGPATFGRAITTREPAGSKASDIAVWLATAALLTISVVISYGIFAFTEISEETWSFFGSLCGGAVLTSLFGTQLPSAFQHGGPLVAGAAAAGVVWAFAISTLGG
jgi:zinc transporter, ZIP family